MLFFTASSMQALHRHCCSYPGLLGIGWLIMPPCIPCSLLFLFSLLGVTWWHSSVPLSLWRMAASPCFASRNILLSSDSLVIASRFARAVFLVCFGNECSRCNLSSQQASCYKFLKFFSEFLCALSVPLCWLILQHIPVLWLETVKCDRWKLHQDAWNTTYPVVPTKLYFQPQ